MDFFCPMCAHCSTSIFALHMHCIVAHPRAFLTCPWCSMPFTFFEFRNHATICPKFDKIAPREGVINTTLVNREQCLVCDGKFPSNEAAIRHYQEQHLNFSFVCDVCRRYFQQFRSWQFHRSTCGHTQKNATSEASNHPSSPLVSTPVSTQNKRTASNAFDGNVEIGAAGPSPKRNGNADNNSAGRSGSGHPLNRLQNDLSIGNPSQDPAPNHRNEQANPISNEPNTPAQPPAPAVNSATRATRSCDLREMCEAAIRQSEKIIEAYGWKSANSKENELATPMSKSRSPSSGLSAVRVVPMYNHIDSPSKNPEGDQSSTASSEAHDSNSDETVHDMIRRLREKYQLANSSSASVIDVENHIEVPLTTHCQIKTEAEDFESITSGDTDDSRDDELGRVTPDLLLVKTEPTEEI